MLSFIPIAVVLLGCLQIVSGYNVGTGIFDVTGPSVEINFMGYAVPGQRGTGIHMRLKARAFAFEDEEKRFVFVSVDGGMGSDLVNFRVVEKLNAALGEGVYSMVRLRPHLHVHTSMC
jgi:neutral ceramidase